MAREKKAALDTFPYDITLRKRYVNETIVVLTDELLDDFSTHITSVHPAVRFTREEEGEGKLAVTRCQHSEERR